MFLEEVEVTNKEKKRADQFNEEYGEIKDLKADRGRWAIGILLIVMALLLGLVLSK